MQDASIVYTDPSVHATLVASPTFTHEAIITASVDAGKTVFAEKPISDTFEGIDRCYDRAAQAGRPIFCAFNRRFEPGFRNVRDRVRAGESTKEGLMRTFN